MTQPSHRPLPVRALIISLASLLVPVMAVLAFPAFTEEEESILIWMTALVPAFLMAYYRGLKGVALALAGAMAALSLAHAALLLTGVTAPAWPVLLSVVAVFVAVCVALAVVSELLHREREAAVRLSVMDQLTGLPNRRQAELTLDMQFAGALRGAPLAVVLFDLDHFKRINDEQGHDAGDTALRAFAEVLRRHTRRMNLSARFGGEEFLSVLTGCSLDQATRFATRVVEETRNTPFSWGPLTASAGVAVYEKGMGSYEVLVAAADRALYAAKDAGRNRVAAASPKPPRLAPTAAPAPGATTTHAVLVIDDDPDLLPVIGKILRRAGYLVELTDDPDVVIDRTRSGARIDLLITDIMMPRMNGLTLVDHLVQLRPALRVVYLSGYVQSTDTWPGLPGAVTGFVGKPLELDNLLRTVRATLEQAPAAAPIG